MSIMNLVRKRERERKKKKKNLEPRGQCKKQLNVIEARLTF